MIEDPPTPEDLRNLPDRVGSSSKGWTCPKCKSVYSPMVKECLKCNVNESSEDSKESVFLQE